MRRLPFALTLVCGCTDPAATARVDTPFATEAVVVDGAYEKDVTWDAAFDIEEAPPGEYFVYAADARPSREAILAYTLDASCSGDCASERLGAPVLTFRQIERGPLSLRVLSSETEAETKASQLFVIGRKNAGTDVLDLTAQLTVRHGGNGCGGLEEPAFATSPVE